MQYMIKKKSITLGGLRVLKVNVTCARLLYVLNSRPIGSIPTEYIYHRREYYRIFAGSKCSWLGLKQQHSMDIPSIKRRFKQFQAQYFSCHCVANKSSAALRIIVYIIVMSSLQFILLFQ